jgi:hypothetical protein
MSCYDHIPRTPARGAKGVTFRSQMNLERRSKARYPIQLAVNYRTLDPGREITGSGRSIDMSSGGLLISCPARFPIGTVLKVTVEWPSLLDGATPLQLVTVGRVARSGESSFAMTFEHYQFRTMPRRNKPRVSTGTAEDAAVRTSQRASESGLAEVDPPSGSASGDTPANSTLRRTG